MHIHPTLPLLLLPTLTSALIFRYPPPEHKGAYSSDTSSSTLPSRPCGSYTRRSNTTDRTPWPLSGAGRITYGDDPDDRQPTSFPDPDSRAQVHLGISISPGKPASRGETIQELMAGSFVQHGGGEVCLDKVDVADAMKKELAGGRWKNGTQATLVVYQRALDSTEGEYWFTTCSEVVLVDDEYLPKDLPECKNSTNIVFEARSAAGAVRVGGALLGSVLFAGALLFGSL